MDTSKLTAEQMRELLPDEALKAMNDRAQALLNTLGDLDYQKAGTVLALAAGAWLACGEGCDVRTPAELHAVFSKLVHDIMEIDIKRIKESRERELTMIVIKL